MPESSSVSCSWRAVCAGLTLGVLCGLAVGAFRLTHDHVCSLLFAWFAGSGLWRPAVWLAVLCGVGVLAGRLVAAQPLLSGSGIPQVELALRGRLKVATTAWADLAIFKFFGSWAVITAGLSLGREGPCIMIGSAAGALLGARRGRTDATWNPYILSGAAAGLAAAFGAPLAGVLFVFEEVRARPNRELLCLAPAASLSAWLVVAYGFGMKRMFAFERFVSPSPAEFAAPALCVVALTLAAVVYTRGLLRLKAYEHRFLPPPPLRALPALLVAGTAAFLLPELLGGGDGLLRRLGTDPGPLHAVAGLLLLKTAFSILSYSGNMPGGLLMPILCIGGLCGTGTALAAVHFGLLDPAAVPSFTVLGMGGCFAAVVGAPLTGIALVLEMTGAFACLPYLIPTAFAAHALTRLVGCPPVYDALRERLIAPDKEEHASDSPAA